MHLEQLSVTEWLELIRSDAGFSSNVALCAKEFTQKRKKKRSEYALNIRVGSKQCGVSYSIGLRLLGLENTVDRTNRA